ncbi:DNA primase family protein [Micromonospora rubida]
MTEQPEAVDRSEDNPSPVGALYDEIAAVADASEDDRLGMARDLIRRVSALSAHTRQEWRDAIRQVVPSITKADFDIIVREERKAQKEKAKEAAAQHYQERRAAEREAAEASGAILPSPADPMAVARALADRLERTDGHPHLGWWRGDFYEWTGSRWAVQRDATVGRWLYLQTEDAVYDSGDDIKRWAPTAGKIGNLTEAFGSAVLARPWDDDDVKCVAVTNGVLDTGRRKLLNHIPARFNLTSLSFAYDPRATCPKWLAFLDQVLGKDDEAKAFLGEWFGYVISGRTDLQKMAHLYGAKRSGKGTIARVLEALLGPEAVAAPSLSSIITNFGEQPLIGKSLAVMSDINWSVRDVGEAVEKLKAISGEDSRDVDRKNREVWHGKLGVRFMILGNDEPKFNDASGALTGRMIHVRFRISFTGKEDPKLTEKLLEESSGILNWALDGLDRLTKRGRFAPPTSSVEAEKEIERNTSPVSGFIDDHAEIDAKAGPVLLDDIYAVYRDWCADEEGRDRASIKAVFSRDLRSAGNGAIEIKREKRDGDEKRGQWVYGLRSQDPEGFKPRPNGWMVGRG